MFTKLTTFKKHSNEIISIDDLVSLISNNPNKDKINYIRSIEYKSKEYNNLKGTLPCIMPHGIFSGLNNSDLISIGSYLYYDIDGFKSTKEVDDTIKQLNDTFPITLLCKSVGGMGISFIINVGEVYDHTEVYSYIRHLFIQAGFNIDISAGGLNRKVIISSDDNVIYNKEVSFGYDLVSSKEWNKSLNQVKKIRTKEERDITANDTFLNLINPKELFTQINIESVYTKEIDGYFNIDEMDYYRIVLPKIIKDGTKHKLYTRIINALFYINPNINNDQIYSYLFYVNTMAIPSMDLYSLKRLVINISNSIRQTGEVKIKPRIKKIHFTKKVKIKKEIKQDMSRQIIGVLRTNKAIEAIENAKMELISKNIEPTQKRVQEVTGFSIAKIKRNWTKQKTEVSDIKFRHTIETKDVMEEINYDIMEADFFNEKNNK